VRQNETKRDTFGVGEDASVMQGVVGSGVGRVVRWMRLIWGLGAGAGLPGLTLGRRDAGKARRHGGAEARRRVLRNEATAPWIFRGFRGVAAGSGVGVGRGRGGSAGGLPWVAGRLRMGAARGIGAAGAETNDASESAGRPGRPFRGRRRVAG
jgi:hypothetical protein